MGMLVHLQTAAQAVVVETQILPQAVLEVQALQDKATQAVRAALVQVVPLPIRMEAAVVPEVLEVQVKQMEQ